MKEQFKTHPIASACFVIYLTIWLWMFYVCYKDYAGNGDGEISGMSILGTVVLAFIPYFAAMELLGYLKKQYKKFYYRVALISTTPIPLIILWIIALKLIFQ
ncbi:hypothetical protein [Mucilaginibacter terrae]|uniref:Uncharacterized protein n=1 Tax=Mucilaginibacter terrae TaxID=1955052 RepID=A0ABU3GPG6_9SPHI|nr:hypothetical protein [Mucilaginibacter terrae]MDT3401674.1 hypothetical protein [Mucilaginibacter terrae]